jgi:SAM-dependent methyltransferase
MSNNESYFEYLNGITWKGRLYRKWILYPRLRAEVTGRCLDVGCGLGGFILSRPDTVGVDINPMLVEFCRSQGLEVDVFNGCDIPFEQSSFDSLILDNVLEHILEPAALLTDFTRVLKSGGKLLIGVPGRKGYESDSDHKVYYTRESLRSLLHEHGFEESNSFEMPFFGLSDKLKMHCVYSTFTLGCR